MHELFSHPVPKVFRSGTARAAPPEQTIARVRAHASALGITRVGNVTGLDRIGIPVAVAVRPGARSISVSQGKGTTLEAAFASALMEAAELSHAEECAWSETWSPALETAEEERVDLECTLRTGRPIGPQTSIPWLRGFDMSSEAACRVPSEMVCMDYGRRSAGGYFVPTSNGLASGNQLAEAVSAGICELVERDAIALWEASSLMRRAACAVDPASVDDPGCVDLLARFQQAHVAVTVWDITSDIGLPVFLCEIRPTREDPSSLGRRFRGSGCHVDPAIALSRALTEAAQARLTYIVGIRDDLGTSVYSGDAAQRAGGLLLDTLAQGADRRQFSACRGFVSDDVTEDIRWQLDRLRTAGLAKVIAVDLTNPNYDLPVVRMVIPGLEADCTDPAYKPGPRARAVALTPA